MPFGCNLIEKSNQHSLKQAQKGFRPLSTMKGIRYFQNLRNSFRNCLDFLGELFGNFLGGFFWRNFFGGIFLGGFFWEELLSRN